MEKAMRTKRNSPVSRADDEGVDLALNDMWPGRVGGAAFGGCPANPPSTGPAPGPGPGGTRKAPLQDSRCVKVSLGDAVQISFATVVRTDDPAEA
jgi:hypothetical protein